MFAASPPYAASLGLLGSSASDGNTARLARAVFRQLPDSALINLGGLNIAPYDYQHRHHGDDFLPVAQRMTKAQAIIFASPVYWYSMSAQMKVFFDRLSDLTEDYKPLGKSLAGKTAFLIATGGAPEAPASFTQPFIDTAGYFNMHWGGEIYSRNDALEEEEIEAFAKRVMSVEKAQP